MALTRHLYNGKSIYIIPQDATSERDTIEVANIDNNRVKLNFTAPRKYHIISEEALTKAGLTLDEYIAQEQHQRDIGGRNRNGK